MSVSINGTNGLVFSDGTSLNTSPFTGGFGFRNRLINAAMVIDQRNSGASVTGNDGVYPVDRWRIETSQSGKFTMQQNQGSVTPPAGFKNYVGITSSSAYSVLSTDRFSFCQWIEGYNVADLNFGTANASPITLSFWVRSSLTGTFGVGVIGYDDVSTFRSYVTTYTISSANTWTYVSITIPGDTSGTWSTTNGHGLYVNFGLGYGSNYTKTAGSWGTGLYYNPTGCVSVVGTSGATFYVTGVQLEKGSTATSFDYRPYGTELALCQRYYQQGAFGCGLAGRASGGVAMYGRFITPMRASPTITYVNSMTMFFAGISTFATTGVGSYGGSTTTGFYIDTITGATPGNSTAGFISADSNIGITYSAEL